jgi:hypothetical protein
MPYTRISDEEKERRAYARKQAREWRKQQALTEAQRTQKPVSRINVSIVWRKSVYGWSPRAAATLIYTDNTTKHTGSVYYAGGCGYDKISTVLADVLSDSILYRIHQKMDAGGAVIPYGVYEHKGRYTIGGGYGLGTVKTIVEWLDGSMEHLVNEKTFDFFSLNFNQG